MDDTVNEVMDLYPRVFMACHQRHARVPDTGRVVSDHQASILDHLDEHDPMSLATLAAHLGVTASTMSLNVDRLEAQGLVRRDRDPGDARRLHLRLTPAGARTSQERSVLDAGLVETLLERIPRSQRARAMEGLRLLAAAADEQMKTGLPRQRRWADEKGHTP